MTNKYGVVKTANSAGRRNKITDIIEKPDPQVAPSNLAVVGRYILTQDIFKFLNKTDRGGRWCDPAHGRPCHVAQRTGCNGI